MIKDSLHCSSCTFKKRNILIPKLILIIIGLFFFFIVSMFLTFSIYAQLILTTHKISELGAQNIELQTEIEYYKEYCDYLEEFYNADSPENQ